MCGRNRTGSADRRFAVGPALSTCDCQILAATRERKKIEMERGEPPRDDDMTWLDGGDLDGPEMRSPARSGPG